MGHRCHLRAHSSRLAVSGCGPAICSPAGLSVGPCIKSKPSTTAPDSTPVLTTKPQPTLNPNKPEIIPSSLSEKTGQAHSDPFFISRLNLERIRTGAGKWQLKLP